MKHFYWFWYVSSWEMVGRDSSEMEAEWLISSLVTENRAQWPRGLIVEAPWGRQVGAEAVPVDSCEMLLP